jgi:hypothetical protein
MSAELLEDVEKALDKLNLEVDTSLSKMQEKSNEVPLISNEHDKGMLDSTITFRVPQVVKGPKESRPKNILEKKYREEQEEK